VSADQRSACVDPISTPSPAIGNPSFARPLEAGAVAVRRGARPGFQSLRTLCYTSGARRCAWCAAPRPATATGPRIPMNRWLHMLGERLAAHLLAPRPHGEMVATVSPDLLAAALRPGDVLLIEGQSRLSMAIKYLTQSNWSHAALYIGSGEGPDVGAVAEGPTLIEADLRDGVRAVPLAAYAYMHTRICRPVGLTAAEIERLVGYAVARIGQRYDLKNLFDLARYLLPVAPVPMHRRRRLLAFGSGDPTRAICSTLIAQAFQAVHYPILPEVTLRDAVDRAGHHCRSELLHIRNYSLFAPRDFDISPYFEIVQPVLRAGFDPHDLVWDATPGGQDQAE